MANTITGLISTAYSSLDTVVRETTGEISAVRKFNFPNRKVAQNEPITFPIVPDLGAPDAISASNVISDPAGMTIGRDTMYMDNVDQKSFDFSGEEYQALSNSGIAETILADAFKQAFRSHVNKICSAIAGQYVYASRAVGARGTVPFNTADDLSGLSTARQALTENGMWRNGKMNIVLNSTAIERLRAKQGVVFKANESGDPNAPASGTPTMLQGFKLHEGGQLGLHTSGAGTGYTTNGTFARGVTAVTVAQDPCTGTGEIGAGDIFTVADESPLYQYVARSMNVGNTSITLNNPGVFSVGGLGSGKAITTVASYTPSLAINEDAIVLVSALPNLPQQGDAATKRFVIQDPVSGIIFEISEYLGFRKVIYTVACAWGVKTVKSEGLVLLIQ